MARKPDTPRIVDGLTVTAHRLDLAVEAIRYRAAARRDAGVAYAGELAADRRAGKITDARTGAVAVVDALAEAAELEQFADDLAAAFEEADTDAARTDLATGLDRRVTAAEAAAAAAGVDPDPDDEDEDPDDEHDDDDDDALAQARAAALADPDVAALHAAATA